MDCSRGFFIYFKLKIWICETKGHFNQYSLTHGFWGNMWYTWSRLTIVYNLPGLGIYRIASEPMHAWPGLVVLWPSKRQSHMYSRMVLCHIVGIATCTWQRGWKGFFLGEPWCSEWGFCKSDEAKWKTLRSPKFVYLHVGKRSVVLRCPSHEWECWWLEVNSTNIYCLVGHVFVYIPNTIAANGALASMYKPIKQCSSCLWGRGAYVFYACP